MRKVKITVVKKVFHSDLSDKYENLISNACPINEGDIFYMSDLNKPDGLCESAYVTLYPFVMTLLHGGEDIYKGWMKNKKSAMVSCNDGFRPVSFYLEVIDED